MISLLACVLLLLNPTATFSVADSFQQVLPSYLQTQHGGWWDHPPKPGCGDKDGWNILYHLGGNGPWIRKIDDVVEGGIEAPEGCEVEMVHMVFHSILMSRHAERYPTKCSGARMLDLVDRVKSSGQELKGVLKFLNDWEPITTSPDKHFEQLTTTGPYAGVLEAFTTGVKLATRYKHLWNNTSPAQTYLWAAGSDRVVSTARYFSAGFFGLESDAAKVIAVNEKDEDKSGDTLTPGKTCKLYVSDPVHGHGMGYQKLYEFRDTYLPAIAQRLKIDNPGLNFTNEEIYTLQELCGFTLTTLGTSPFCSIFTHSEWSSFEYARDIIHFYRAGPGNPYSIALGSLYLNATLSLLLEGPESAGPFYFTFVHDGDIIPMLSALRLFPDPKDLSVTHIEQARKWKTSQVTPMGGRILFERLNCGGNKHVRLNVNDGIVALPGCDSGPGKSCPLDQFAGHIRKRVEEGGDFRKVCGLPADTPVGLTFLRQPGYPKE